MEALSALHRRLTEGAPAGTLERLARGVLAPFGRIYGAVGAIRAGLYRRGLLSSHRAGIPVISVGNITAGGTGKTPTVDLLVKLLLAEGIRVAVVSRGYGVRIKGVRVVCAGDGPLLSPGECGDEPYLLARRNPGALVLVAPRRRDGVKMAEEVLGAQAIILDDGFQHLAVRRDLDIVLLDASRPFGNGHTLPAGSLRESPQALRRGNLFLLTRCPEREGGVPEGIPGPVFCSRHILSSLTVSLDGKEIPLESLVGKRGIAFAGVADPDSFFEGLEAAGLTLAEKVVFADHVPYGPDEISRLGTLSHRADYLVTTEKDGVKLYAAPFPVPCLQVPMKLQIQEEGDFEKAVFAALRRPEA